jgi:ketosteroid isomerase-like protein
MQQTTTDHPNAKLVREGLEAFNRGDVQGFADLIADDVVWHQIGAETVRGKQAMAQSLPGGEVDWNITADVHDVVANDEHAIALVEAHATRGDGRKLDYRTAEIMHIRDGKLTERWAFSDDTQRIIDFFA